MREMRAARESISSDAFPCNSLKGGGMLMDEASASFLFLMEGER